jgi:uncharacterized protein
MSGPTAVRVRRTRRFLEACAALLALSFMSPADPASAEVRLTRDSMDADYRVRVMTWWEIPFRSVVRQQHDFSCGSAAVATLLTYHYGRPTAETETFSYMWRNGNQETIRRVGFSMLEMRSFLRGLGYRSEGYRLTLDELRRMDRPSIALIDYEGFKHFVVIKGIRGDRILLGDSVLGLTEYDINDFARMWNGIVLAIADSVETVPARYDLASDWGPWSRAPMEQGSGGIRIATGDLTTHLPPDYQIAPDFLLQVRVGTVR